MLAPHGSQVAHHTQAGPLAPTQPHSTQCSSMPFDPVSQVLRGQQETLDHTAQTYMQECLSHH